MDESAQGGGVCVCVWDRRGCDQLRLTTLSGRQRGLSRNEPRRSQVGLTFTVIQLNPHSTTDSELFPLSFGLI